MSDTNPAIDRPEPERPASGADDEAQVTDEDREGLGSAPALLRRDSGGDPMS